MIKGIFFDAAGVLYRREKPTEEYALDLLKQEGYSTEISAADLDHQLVLKGRASKGLVAHDAYWDWFLQVRGVKDADMRGTMITSILEFSNHVLPVHGGRETLGSLKQRGYILGLVTDTMYPLEWKMRRLEKAGVAEYIDVIACSTVVGVHKPDPAMYLNALQKAGLEPGESAFVGHLGAELEGAHQAGMTTVAVNNDPDVQADYYCASLPDLLSIFPSPE